MSIWVWDKECPGTKKKLRRMLSGRVAHQRARVLCDRDQSRYVIVCFLDHIDGGKLIAFAASTNLELGLKLMEIVESIPGRRTPIKHHGLKDCEAVIAQVVKEQMEEVAD